MRRLLHIVTAIVCASALSAGPAAAFCNDGILQPSEQCDSTALPNGSAACPGRCIQPPNLQACMCANLSNDIRDFAIIADLQARISSTAAVISGGVAVTTDGGFLYVGANALTPGSEQAIGDRCRLLPGANVGRLFCNEPLVLPGAFVNDGGPFFFGPPVTFSNLPAFPSFLGGGNDVTVVSGDTQYLAPGSYGTIVVSPKGTLVLHGLDLSSGVGSYDVLAVKVMGGAKLFADNPVQVNVSNGFRLTGDSMLGPTPGTSLQPGDVEVNVSGRAVKLGKGAFVQAHVRSLTGKIVVGKNTTAVGQLIGPKVTLQKGSLLQYGGGCGDGEKQATEICDLTAPNGDAACPGECIAFNQPGQCSCRCDNNADCNDGNACNGVETCDSGHCVLGAPPVCTDNNPCTLDCNPGIGCVSVPVTDGTGCDDGNECTKTDKCMAGTCVPGEPRLCSDGNSCTTDTCDPAAGCQHEELPTGTACTDDNLCTGGDACIHGTCIPGAPADCNDLNPCTVDTCTAADGCRHDNVLNGVSCAGPSPCTAEDFCNDGLCTSGVATLCSDSNPCTFETCTLEGPIGSQTAKCTSTPLPNFTPCGPNGLVCFNNICQ